MTTATSDSNTQSSNIFGATGLSRAALAAFYRQRGLFGEDSDLSPAEQAVVQAGLPPIAGLKSRGLAIRSTPGLAALGAYVEALVAGRSAIGERARAEAAGLLPKAANEVATVIGDVLAVFEPTRPVVPAREVPSYARAA